MYIYDLRLIFTFYVNEIAVVIKRFRVRVAGFINCILGTTADRFGHGADVVVGFCIAARVRDSVPEAV